MNMRLFSEAMSEVGDRYYEEVARYKRKGKNPAWIKWGTAAACFAVSIAVYMFIPQPADKPTPIPQEDEIMAETSNLNIYYLSENGIIESKNVTVTCTPKAIFGEWAVLNGVSGVTVVDCVYSDGGAANTGPLVTEHSSGNYSILNLTVSPEFSAYTVNEDSELLIESLRQTFYDYINFDEFNLITGELTYQMISMGVLEPGMQADDGKSLVWEGMNEREINGTECYTFELRYSEDESENGEMAARLIGIYAISKDGMKIYHYDQADDIWKQMWSDNESSMEPVGQADDGKSLVWEEVNIKEIEGEECYAFELRYSDDEDVNGEMAGRLIGIYAISKDGMTIYYYDQADDIWEQLQSTAQ